MGHGSFFFPAPSSLPVLPYSGSGWNATHYYHHHFHFFTHNMTPATISYYSCFPAQLPPPPQLHLFPSFHYQLPHLSPVEEIDGPADGHSQEHQLAMTENGSEIVFYPCKDDKIPCLGRRRRGVGKRFVTACWEQNRVYAAPRKTSDQLINRHGTRSRAGRGHAAAAAWVPKAKPVKVKDVEDTADAEKTTLMIKNIPNRFNRGSLISIIDGLCKREYGGQEEYSASAYDFVYLPIDFKNGCNLGYAFVNFTTAGAALWVSKQLHNHEWKTYGSKKVCAITYARIQGKKSLVDRFKNSIFPCDSDDFLPVVFSPPRDGFASCPQPKLVGKRNLSL